MVSTYSRHSCKMENGKMLKIQNGFNVWLKSLFEYFPLCYSRLPYKLHEMTEQWIKILQILTKPYLHWSSWKGYWRLLNWKECHKHFKDWDVMGLIKKISSESQINECWKFTGQNFSKSLEDSSNILVNLFVSFSVSKELLFIIEK